MRSGISQTGIRGRFRSPPGGLPKGGDSFSIICPALVIAVLLVITLLLVIAVPLVIVDLHVVAVLLVVTVSLVVTVLLVVTSPLVFVSPLVFDVLHVVADLAVPLAILAIPGLQHWNVRDGGWEDRGYAPDSFPTFWRTNPQAARRK